MQDQKHGFLMYYLQVKLTREHHLVTAADLASGEYDDVLKGTFDALVCAKHDEPLKLYCTEPSCLTPICTVSIHFMISLIKGFIHNRILR